MRSSFQAHPGTPPVEGGAASKPRQGTDKRERARAILSVHAPAKFSVLTRYMRYITRDVARVRDFGVPAGAPNPTKTHLSRHLLSPLQNSTG